ncbi:MAG: PatB family C-S lyase [Treponema sp.]|nr:PatB family C-S lyase [Treponema sp.]
MALLYDFDQIIRRKGTSCNKWDGMKGIFTKDGLLPMWIADMDFTCPDPVLEAVRERMKHPIYGYSFPPDSCYEAIINKLYRDYGWRIEKEWIVFTHGVVDGIHSAIKAVTSPGDGVIVQRPVYYPFFSVILDNHCQLQNNPLLNTGGYYTIDYDNLKSQFQSRTKALLFCSPHNPVGRVWKEEELKRLGDICLRNRCIILSDEIHSDITYGTHKHRVFASIDKEIEARSMTFLSASKTFNVPGLTTAYAVIPNKELRDAYLSARMKQMGGNLFGYAALEAAYNLGGEYKAELLRYVKKNTDCFSGYIDSYLPELKLMPPEGSYLLWVDMRRLDLTQERLSQLMEECGLALDDGRLFGPEGAGFWRFNVACPESYVRQALDNMKNIIPRLCRPA